MTDTWPTLSDPAKALRDELFSRLWIDGWTLDTHPTPTMENIDPPNLYGSAVDIHSSIGSDAAAVALYDHENHIRAYELHGRGGPWLLTVDAYNEYLTLCANSASSPA